jgi:hypothetical protein
MMSALGLTLLAVSGASFQKFKSVYHNNLQDTIPVNIALLTSLKLFGRAWGHVRQSKDRTLFGSRQSAWHRVSAPLRGGTV